MRNEEWGMGREQGAGNREQRICWSEAWDYGVVKMNRNSSFCLSPYFFVG